ncbi:hypothetical protein CEK26_002409 [Fusarium fujikuroi]|nr:hypothetical protein CEK26_002409 [Fusarium fujikuroi]
MSSPVDSDMKGLHQVHDDPHDDLERDTESPVNDVVDANFQRGVQNIEAVTLSWSRTALMVAFVLIWLVYFVQGLVSGISSALIPYVTSAFAMHSLTPTTSVLSSVIGGVTNLSIAKTLDIFGRPQGFLFCATLATLGLIMSAACNNVEAYAASQVFYTVGINGVGYSLSVFIADTTSLRHRGLIQSICGSPSIITAWLGGPISTAFLNGAGWRWAFGMESILVPGVTIPLFGLFMHHYLRAKKQGILPKRETQSISYYIREFDVVGLLSLSAGDRTVAGACLLSFTLFFSYMCWGMYFSSILQVVNNLSVTHASYVVSTYTVGGFLFAIFVGMAMSYTGNFKAVTLYVALPLSILGSGLMIYFRHPDQSIGYIAMSQIFIAFGSGAIMITAEIAILAAVQEQQYFAVSIALVSMCASIGSAVGLTVSSAIWQDILPKKLAEYLPEEDLPNLPMIAMDLVTQLSYPVGSPTRLAIQHAYGDAHKYLFIAGTAVWSIGILGVVMWKNINIINIKQTKGRVV